MSLIRSLGFSICVVLAFLVLVSSLTSSEKGLSADLPSYLINLSALFPSYLVVKPEEKSYSARLFISSDLLSPKSAAYSYLTEDLKVKVEEYDDVWKYLTSGKWTDDAAKKLVCGETVSWAVVDSVGIPNAHILTQSPLSFWKAVKNDVEVEGMRRAYLRDGVCWVKWAAWLEEAIRLNKEKIDEKTTADALIGLREKADKYAGMESYDAISASGENAGKKRGDCF
jgi:Xaa-Pro aminopeptidase